MRSLLRVPYVRQGIMLKVLAWMGQGVEALARHNEAEVQRRESAAYTLIDTSSHVFYVERGGGLPGRLDIQNYLLQCLRCFKYLSTSNSLDDKSPAAVFSLLGLELLKSPGEDPGSLALAKLESVPAKDTLLSQIVSLIVVYLGIIEKNPGYVTGVSSSEQAEVESFWEQILSVLSTIFKQVATSLKLMPDKEPRPAVPLQPQVVQQLCNILLTTEFKNRSSLRSIKAIFAHISSFSGEGQEFIQGFFKHTLSEALEAFMQLILGERVDGILLKKRVTVISSILKFAKGNTSQEANICDQDLFHRVVTAISAFIESKRFDSIASSTQQAAIMFKEEFRTIISTLFILFEYNLKFIFTDASDEIFTKKKSQAASKVTVTMQDTEEMKREFEAPQMERQQSSITEAIDQHL